MGEFEVGSTGIQKCVTIWPSKKSKQNLSCAKFQVYSLAYFTAGQVNSREKHTLNLCDYVRSDPI